MAKGKKVKKSYVIQIVYTQKQQQQKKQNRT